MDLFQFTASIEPAKSAAIRAWVKEILGLGPDRIVVVTQLQCREEGCPPLETVVAVTGKTGGMVQYKFHSSLGEVTREKVLEVLSRPSSDGAKEAPAHA